MCHLNERTSARRGSGLRFWHLMKSPGCAFCIENDYMGDGIRSERHCYTSAKTETRREHIPRSEAKSPKASSMRGVPRNAIPSPHAHLTSTAIFRLKYTQKISALFAPLRLCVKNELPY